MGSIQYRKEFTIKKKILREEDILRMAKLIHKQFQQGDFEEEYVIYFDDKSCIVGKNDMDVFKTYEFKRRRCKHLCFTYKSECLEKSIEINLYNSVMTPVNSSIEIRSDDIDWFNSICNEISTVISEIEERKFVITDSTKFFGSLIVSAIETFLTSCAICKIFPNMNTTPKFVFIAMMASIIFLSINYYLLFELMRKAFPSVEFSFGPTYLNKSQKIRNSLGVLVPFLIDVIFFAIGYWG